MQKPSTMKALEELGRVRLSPNFYLRDFLYSEIANFYRIPKNVKLSGNQQDRDMMARELLIKFQMSPKHPMVSLNKAYRKF